MGRSVPGAGGGMALLKKKIVQDELKLTDEQKAKIATIATEEKSKMRELLANVENVPEAKRKETMQKGVKEIREASLKTVALKPEQLKRLKQIQLQQLPLVTLSSDEEIIKVLKITDEQKEKLKKIRVAVNTKDQEKGPVGQINGKFDVEKFEKMKALRKEADDKAIKLLTGDQQAKWKELTGEPVDIDVRK